MTHPVDSHVGKRVRHRRKLLGMTQQQLARSVGIRFQQIQKYESGTNRISASRLWDLSSALQVPVAYFFEGLDSEAQNGSHVGALDADVMHDKETIDLVRAYYGLAKYPRRRLLELTKALSNSEH